MKVCVWIFLKKVIWGRLIFSRLGQASLGPALLSCWVLSPFHRVGQLGSPSPAHTAGLSRGEWISDDWVSLSA